MLSVKKGKAPGDVNWIELLISLRQYTAYRTGSDLEGTSRNWLLVAGPICYKDPKFFQLDIYPGSKNFHRFKGAPCYAYFMENCRILL